MTVVYSSRKEDNMDMILRALGIGLSVATGLLLLVGSLVWAEEQDSPWAAIAVAFFWIMVIVSGLAYLVMRQGAVG